MRFSFDRTGFPLAEMPQLRLDVQLLPVTKVQFERFLADTDSWYEEVLKANPRISYHRFTSKNRECIFLTNILPTEAQRFATWMGTEYRLPSVTEWRSIYQALKRYAIGEMSCVLSQPEQLRTTTILRRLTEQLCPLSLLDISLMRGGVLEWSTQSDEWVGLGCPRSQFHPNLWEPLLESVSPLDHEQRCAYFGLRLIRSRSDMRHLGVCEHM